VQLDRGNQYVTTPRPSFSGGQGRFTTLGYPVSSAERFFRLAGELFDIEKSAVTQAAIVDFLQRHHSVSLRQHSFLLIYCNSFSAAKRLPAFCEAGRAYATS